MPTPSKISSSLNIISPLDQVAPAYIRDYLGILNPLFGRYGGSELKFYLGFIPAFFVFYAIFALRNKFIGTLAIPGILSLWISLGHKAFLSSVCFYVLPLFKYVRVMEHFSLAPVYIGFVFISAFGFEAFLEKADASEDLNSFWKYIYRHLWLFIIGAIIITIVYHKGFIKSLLVLSYYFLPVIVILVFRFMSKNLRKVDKFMMRIISLLCATSIIIISFVFFGRPFSGELFLNINRLILIFTAFCVTLSYIILHLNELTKKRSSIIAVICLSIIFIDLVFLTSLSTYLRAQRRADTIVPERVEPFEYQNYRMESFWPPGLKKVSFHRPSMLFMQSSVLTEGIHRECDYYMLKKFWEAYSRLPEGIKRVVMAIDIPKLIFFTDYKVMDDESIFKECENLNPELLKHYIYLAPDDYEVPSIRKIPKRQASSEGIEVEYFDNNRLKLSIDAKEDGLLYYSDGYDKNWKCFVDGKQQPIYRANIAFKAVYIPEGRHTVSFVYKPVLYLISLWLFLAACVICIISIYWGWGRSKQFRRKTIR